ncbi:hypothetical protein DFJ77DRAFT_525078 [Powellomyces hirtus]|nr:hypothetical protein DFJ77DRAFT_525078 [Powellomyces hirtus]
MVTTAPIKRPREKVELQCEYCDDRFQIKRLLRLHTKEHLACSGCQRQCRTLNSLKFHVLRDHQNSVPVPEKIIRLSQSSSGDSGDSLEQAAKRRRLSDDDRHVSNHTDEAIAAIVRAVSAAVASVEADEPNTSVVTSIDKQETTNANIARNFEEEHDTNNNVNVNININEEEPPRMEDGTEAPHEKPIAIKLTVVTGTQTEAPTDVGGTTCESPQAVSSGSSPSGATSPTSPQSAGSTSSGATTTTTSSSSSTSVLPRTRKSNAPSPESRSGHSILSNASSNGNSNNHRLLAPIPSPEQVSVFRLLTTYNALIPHVTAHMLSPAANTHDTTNTMSATIKPAVTHTDGELGLLQRLLQTNIDRVGWNVQHLNIERREDAGFVNLLDLHLTVQPRRQTNRLRELCETVSMWEEWSGAIRSFRIFAAM